LVKGLEFDHVLVLKTDDFGEAENPYVALPRGAKSLVLHSTEPPLQRPLPQFTA
jgi:DNA helicase IV